MKQLLNFVMLSVVILLNFANAVDIKSLEHHYASNNVATITSTDQPRNAEDWIGIYLVGDNNSWGNVIDWSWAKDESNSLYNFINLPDGNYEARFFFNNTFKTEASVPFIVGDVVSIHALKETYGVNEDIGVNVAKISGDRDWVGIYPKGSSNSWGNVVKWSWAENNGTINIAGVNLGEYEARLFFHNSFIIESKVTFSVSNASQTTLSTSKDNYAVNEMVSVNVSNLSGDRDWVGTYPKSANNSWGNVIAWNWVTGNGSFDLSTIKIEDMPAGEYEARLFFHNSYKDEKTYEFSVGDNAYIYGSEGAYLNNVKINNDSDKYVVYYPEGHVQDAPLVLVAGFRNTIKSASNKYRLEGLMKYLASQGCYVIGHKELDEDDHWLDTEARRKYYIDAIENAKNLGVDTSKLGIVGKSAGGMHSYALMKYFKGEKNYGGKKSFIIDVIGYFALNMTKIDLEGLNIDSLILHFGGYTGYQTKYSQDPRTLLTISHILNHDDFKVGFIPIFTEDHSYSSGDYNKFKHKNDLLTPIDAMIKYEFFNENGKYNNATDILFNQYNETTKRVEKETLEYLDGKTSIEVYGKDDTHCREDINGINYCEDYK